MSTDLELARAVRRHDLKVAIDGPAGAGKSTVGRGLAGVLECPYLDTGLMYRAVTVKALANRIHLDGGDALVEIARRIDFRFGSESDQSLFIDGAEPGTELHSRAVEDAVSVVAAQPAVRRVMVQRQRDLAVGTPIVMIGRDIGTVVLPDAPVKLWVTASLEERTRRRRSERRETGDSSRAAIARLERRDELDANRPVSPALPAPDAVVLQTDGIPPDDVMRLALDVVRAALLPDADRRMVVRMDSGSW